MNLCLAQRTLEIVTLRPEGLSLRLKVEALSLSFKTFTIVELNAIHWINFVFLKIFSGPLALLRSHPTRADGRIMVIMKTTKSSVWLDMT